KAINDQFGKDLLKAGAISLPVTLAILLLTFGALVAAGIPLLLALTSVFAALGLLAIPSHVLPMDDAVNAVVLLIGLAVGVDYSMFYLKRAREERAAGRTECASIEAAAATSGRSVLIWGAVVGRVLRRPLLWGGLAAVLLIAIALPAVRLHTTQGSTESYPRSLKVIQSYDKIQAAFPGDATAAQVVVEASDVRSAEVQ